MKPLIVLILCASLGFTEPAIRGFTADDLKTERDREAQAKAVPQPERIRGYVKRISAEPHHAGSPGSLAVANYLLGQLKEWGLDARMENFEALLPYPTSRALEMVKPVHFTAKLKEPAIPEDPDSGDANQLPTYNAYSNSGDVTAPLVYVNYGVPEDYDYLKQKGIDVAGKIVIARYGKSWRGVKPKVAQEHGAVGCLIYSDPRDDGYFQGDVYPKGAYRPAQGVQRGSVIDMALYPGDPLSPGWASEKGSKRLTRAEAKSLLKIPVMPISYGDAKPLLQHLGGPVAPEGWRGALPITYHIGPGASVAHLKLDFDWTIKPVHNVIATIPGAVFKDQWVMYGNHHDAWVNGASDPTSGAAALLETARTLAALVKHGWKPKRTIMLALWDAEEFGLIGSTEWAEKHQNDLDHKLAVYINSDSNGKGTISGSGSHGLEQFVSEVLRDVQDPASGKTLLEARQAHPRGTPQKPDLKEFHLGPLGAGSDYVAFIDHIGVSSLNLGFGGEGGGGVYHSIYDSYHWYTNFSDSDFTYGRALSQVMSLSLMRLADAPLLPFEFGALARTLRGYVDEIQKEAGKVSHTVDFGAINMQLARLEANVRNYDEQTADSEKRLDSAPLEKLAHLNEILYRSERALTSHKGLPGREWYRHQLYAPGMYTGYGAKTLPGVREAVEGGRWEEAAHQVLQIAGALKELNAQIAESIKLLREL
jgi:N-acetylated-alpha-linked acidic dipeptidase